MVQLVWDKEAHHARERVIHGSIDLKDESGTMFVRLTQVAPFHADDRGPEWTTVNHEYWDFEQSGWITDNPLISSIKDRNQLNVFEKEEEQEFFDLLNRAIACYHQENKLTGTGSSAVTTCKSVRTPI